MRSAEKTGRKNVSPGWLRTCEVGATLGAPPRDFPDTGKEGEVPAPSGFLRRTLQPCQLVRAPRKHCAILLCGHGPRGLGVTLGAPPLKPRQEPEVPARCSIVALLPVGRIARFAPHLQVAVSATGRAPFRCLPVFTQNHAAAPARPRFARTLRERLCAAARRG